MVDIIQNGIFRVGRFPQIHSDGRLAYFYIVKNDGLDLLFKCVGELIAIAAKDFDAVKLCGVMRR